MSYTELDAYEKIAEAVEEGHCNCYYIKNVVIGMTEKQLGNPNIKGTVGEKKLQNRLKFLKGEK